MAKAKLPEDVPGDAVASARQVTLYWYNIGLDIGSIDRHREMPPHEQPVVYEIRIKCDITDAEGVLVVVKAWGEEGAVVGFHRAEMVVEALSGVAKRIANGTLKWRQDEYSDNTRS